LERVSNERRRTRRTFSQDGEGTIRTRSYFEVAAWDADGNWVQLGDNDTVVGWQSPEEVLTIMNKVAAM
jgi:hypothetical protein